ncbi:MAG: prenyltransferase/squalene oxidase repeat-containing protein [Candidatus Thorarchaeota archaeon]
MTWIPLLLSDPSPSLRLLVLKELLNRQDNDPEVLELKELQENDTLITSLLKFQLPDGSWNKDDLGSTAPGGHIQATSQALVRLGYLQIPYDHPYIKKGIEFMFSCQNSDGSWPLPKFKRRNEFSGYDMQPLQTAIPLEGIAACGYSTDKRAEKGYEWLLNKRLDDGAWPVGITSGVYGKIGGYRRIAHSRWGCRSTTLAVLNCFSYHPKRKNSSEIKRAMDLILGTEVKDKYNLGFVISRLIGLEPSRGWISYYPKLDPAHILNLSWKIGIDSTDQRLSELIEFVKNLKGEYGLWDCNLHPQASRWLTFDLLCSLSKLKYKGDWISFEPRTPFRAYPKKEKRF